MDTYTHCVCTQESSQTAFAILDGEISTIRIVCTRLGAVILAVDGYNKNHNYLNMHIECYPVLLLTTGLISGVTLDRGHPEVG